MDEINRTSPPATKNGTQWEVQLNAIPTPEWLDLFKVSGEGSVTASPQRVVFDRNVLVFKSDESRVEHWVQSIDKWMASTNARAAMRFESASRERAAREDAETKERERIRQLNERFKDL
ncbi:MAG: hypothetical protein HYU41_16570 [Candidatus Rokubacteria bacterium]|nr:hypothetical protein [Candidatus Rokubacteria bacterium]